ncbi:MAG: hypothetical protein AAGC70_21315 [Pseudomonadota bacterium]
MAEAGVREEKIAEVRRALDTLQRLSQEIEAHEPRPQAQPSRLWIDPAKQTAATALIATDSTTEQAAPPRNYLPAALAVTAAGTASAAVIAFALGVAQPEGTNGTGSAQPTASVTAMNESSATTSARTATGVASATAATSTAATSAVAETEATSRSDTSSSAPASSSESSAVAGSPLPQGTARTPAPDPTVAQTQPQPSTAQPTQSASTEVAALPPSSSAPPVPTTTPGASPVATAPTKGKALDRARELFASGKIKEGRTVLTAARPEQSPDVAWALARSFDPRFLRSVPNANSGHDVAQAARWYRVWHATAQRQGLVSSRMDVEKIIRSMN